MDNGNKNSPKVLTTNDIRKNARDWTLAGDVGLLAHLEQFSENIINKTQETENNLNELVDHYEELYTKVGNITNQFLALQNCQFVENRVYDEETPTEEKPKEKVKDEAEKEKLLLMQYKEAVEVGIKILDTHFHEVQLPPNSDSDEDDENSAGNSIIWKPKNPYASKKFPLLIGSAEWWADDNVGLGSNEDSLDTDKIISESESEMESLKSVEKTTKSSSSSSMENINTATKKPTLLESSSEDLFGFDKNESQTIASENVSKGSSSLVEEPVKFLPDLEKETNNKTDAVAEEQQPSQTDDKPKKVDNAFTRELMAKLVSVTNKNEKTEVKPVNEDLFDETDDSSDLFSSKTTKKVGDGKGLFGDVVKDEEDLFSGDDLFKTTGSENFVKKTEPILVPEKKEQPITEKKNSVNDLFDDLDDDDTLFAAKPTPKTTDKRLSSMEPEEDIFNESKPKTTAKLDCDNEEGLFDGINTGVDDDFFSSSGLFDVNVNKTVESTSKVDSKPEDDLFSTDNHQIETETPRESKTENIFEDPFGFSSGKEPTDKKSILDSDEEDDLFSATLKKPSKSLNEVIRSNENNSHNADDDSLFSEKPKLPDNTSISSSRSSLFDDSTTSKSRLASVFEKDKVTKPEDDLFNDDPLFGGKDSFGKKDREKGLFDDWDDGDDLFKEKQVAGETEDADLFSDKSPKPKPPSSLSLKPKESEPKTKPVGKLNIPDNLKVKFESVAKHISPGGVKPSVEDKKEVLDEPPPSCNLLKCPSKDRVKIPGRRRPQSRRARQEAIRNSGVWDEPSSPGNSSNVGQAKDLLPSPAPSNPLSPSTDEEDFFKVPELDTNFEKEDQNIFKSDLFESAKTSKLFDGSPGTPTKTQKDTKSIFDDDEYGNLNDDDESLFKPSKLEPGVFVKKKSLFDLDDDDDDDLFGGKQETSTTTTNTTATNLENAKQSSGEKEKTNFVDPLGLITKD